MSLNEYHMNLITMMEGNEEGDKTIEYFGNLIKENEELKKRDEEARKLFEESNEKMMERIKTEEDKVKKIDQELDVYKEADTQMTSQIEDLEDEKEELENEKEEFASIIAGHEEEIEKLKKENEKLEELAYDYIDGGKTCASILKNYRDEMNIIQKLDEDESELEDIVCVAPYIKKLKEQIKNYKINEESRELLINELKTKNIELQKNQSSMTDYDIGTIYEMINSMDFDPNLNLYTGFRDFDFEEFLENVKSKMHNDTMIIIPNDLKEAVELQSKIHKDYAMRRDRMQDYIRKFKKDKEDRVKILKEELKKLEKELNIY